MDPQTQQLLNASLELARENNAILQKLLRAQKRTQLFQYLYWGIIALSLFGSYIFLSPYLSNLLNLYTGGASGTTSMKDVIKGLDPKTLQQEINDLNSSTN